jgi:hypothetical protein
MSEGMLSRCALAVRFASLPSPVIFRALVIECLDPAFLRSVHGGGARYHFLVLVLVVCPRHFSIHDFQHNQ